MRAAAILGLGCSPRDLKPFQRDPSVEWRMGVPAAGDQVDVILLFGGDGTVHRHLGQIVKLGFPVLVVPAGSGNDFACSLDLRRLRDSLNAWQRFSNRGDNVRAIDIGALTPLSSAGEPPAPQKYFSCVAGVGLDGEVARRANNMPRWLRRHGGYALSVVPAALTFAPVPMKILKPSENPDGGEPDWTVYREEPILVAAFANTPLYGGGMKVAPKAKMDDGLLDVCIVGGVDRFKLLSIFPTVYAGKHLGIREVDYFHSARLRVETEDPLEVYADGEYVCRTPIEVSVQHGVLKVVVPDRE